MTTDGKGRSLVLYTDRSPKEKHVGRGWVRLIRMAERIYREEDGRPLMEIAPT